MDKNKEKDKDKDKFALQEFLTIQKYVTNAYNMWAGECVNNDLRTGFFDLLEKEHAIQNELFCEMNEKGFYPVKSSTAKDLNELKQKFL